MLAGLSKQSCTKTISHMIAALERKNFVNAEACAGETFEGKTLW